MSLSSSTEKSSHRPASPAPMPWSPTSATQEILTSDHVLGSESDLPNSPGLMQRKGFEMQVFNDEQREVAHSEPTFRLSTSTLSPMQILFSRIEANDRGFIRQLLAKRSEQEKLGISPDAIDPESGRTPLTAALALGHLDLVVDLLTLGADAEKGDGQGRKPVTVAGNNLMAVMVLQFINLWRACGEPEEGDSEAGKHYQQLHTRIDPATGHTMLTWSICRHHDELTARLVRSSPDFRICNRHGFTALEAAITTGSVGSVATLLDAWPSLATKQHLEFFIKMVRRSVKKNRPMVLAQLLSFFRRRHDDQISKLEENSFHRLPSDASTQKEIYQSVLGIQSAKQPTIEKIMHQTRDDFLLTEDESRLLGLGKILAFAKQKELKKIVEIIHAHAKLPADAQAST